jgi:hypothetical protein
MVRATCRIEHPVFPRNCAIEAIYVRWLDDFSCDHAYPVLAGVLKPSVIDLESSVKVRSGEFLRDG